MTPAPTVDINQRLRKLANLHTLNIPDLFQLGRLSPVPNGLKEHTHAGMFEICYHLESSQVYELQGRRCEVQSGDMLIIPPGLPHSMGRPAGGPSMMYYFLFCCPSNTSAFMGLETPLSNYIRDSLYSIGEGRIFQGSGAIRALLEQIIQMYFSDSPFRLLRIRYLTVEFFYHLVRQIERDERSAQMPEDIRDVLEYVESLPARHFSSEELALRRIFLCLSSKKNSKRIPALPPIFIWFGAKSSFPRSCCAAPLCLLRRLPPSWAFPPASTFPPCLSASAG